MSFSGMINWIVFTSLETKNTNKISGIRNLTANCKMHFLLKNLLLHCYHKCQNSGRNIPWWTHKPLPLLPERNCSDSPRAGTVPTVSFSVAFHQLSSARSLEQACRNFRFWTHEEYWVCLNLCHQEYQALFWSPQYTRGMKAVRDSLQGQSLSRTGWGSWAHLAGEGWIG